MIGTLEQLFDYEQVEDAWIALRGKTDRTFREFSDDDKEANKEPYCEVQMTDVTVIGEYPYRGEVLPHEWTGKIITRHVTFRGINSDKQREMKSRTRLAILRWASIFTASVLPYHQVMMMREVSFSQGVDEMLDWSEIQADVIFRIRESAWPE